MDISLHENSKKSAFANTFRSQITEDAITLQFGYAPDLEKIDENNDSVSVVGEVSFPPEMLITLVAKLLLTGHSYQIEYQKDIGININEAEEEVAQDVDDGDQK